MIYDRQWFRDVRAKLEEANGLKTTPPQNDHSAPFVKPEEIDYGMYACFTPANEYVLVYDATAAAPKKVAISDLMSTGCVTSINGTTGAVTLTHIDTAPCEYQPPDFDGA